MANGKESVIFLEPQTAQAIPASKKSRNTSNRANHRVAIRSYINEQDVEQTRTTFRQFQMITYVSFKRIFDTLIALIGLILLSPIMLAIAIAIKIDSKGPVFFKQLRTGKYGKEFYIIKFRSMVADNDIRNTEKDDQTTRVGKLLRKTSLDEIPQLFNVLKQDMAIIGPRPWIPEYYKNMNSHQQRRNDVRPGLTGLAQCSGRNKLTIFDKIRYDLIYIKNYSLKQDIKVVLLTIKCVVTGAGVGNGKQTVQQEIRALKKYNHREE